MKIYSQQVRGKVEERFERDFNYIPLDVVLKLTDGCLSEYILKPSIEELKTHFDGKNEDEILEQYDDSEHYPMWGTVFEARDRMMSRYLVKNGDKLYNIGIGMIDGVDDSFLSMMFVKGAGYNFYHAHWIPLYVDVLGWVSDEADSSRHRNP